jgi:hypothetical protein
MVESIKHWLAGHGLERTHLYYEKFTESNT